MDAGTPVPQVTQPLSPIFKRLSFEDIPGWAHDQHAQAFSAFRLSAIKAAQKPYKTGSLGVSQSAFLTAFAAARAMGEVVSSGAAREFFEDWFRPYRIVGHDGFVTGYFEPEVDASLERTDEFSVPLYRKPDDLVKIDPDAPPPGVEQGYAFARSQGGVLGPYFDRQAIEQGALSGRGLEICWLRDPIDAFFIHVQGSARLKLPDGQVMRVGYAAKSGHPFTGIGRALAELGELPADGVTMQSIRDWLAANPDRQQEIMWRNRSFIFFQEMPGPDAQLGPIGAAKVQLTPGRSIAVDRFLHTYPTPFFINAPQLTHVTGSPFQKLMIAQDTGSAIIGPARADLFIGSGNAAGAIAGSIKHEAEFIALLPASLIGEQYR
ncbi:murein transglycosylase A [Nitratireductor basaltis]|uniref:peptidoglycan lytic exotransglycosylase n=1 Tax=Nitratireductor basaltis TaxID=472175 RepID=A0A084U6B8_9HYPH|nr:murein transglycosylase A [Nitratireductor basaltis]KFB08504.1 MltA [Nitratireductor basaltis]